MEQTIHDLLFAPLLALYSIIQWLLNKLLAPSPPAPSSEVRSDTKRIAVIGAGLTGVAAASHIVGHGFEAQIFEAGGKDALGGIWAKVNNTSGLQINSLMYRFQPSIQWSQGYPKRAEIVGEIVKLWKRYNLEQRTQFNTKVTKVYQDEHNRWIINDPSNGRFDGVIAAVGTCGDAKMPHMSGQDSFKGPVYHSSQLDGKNVKGKKVAIIGGGASAVEALEFVDQGQAAETNILARSEKWIIPRNAVVDALLSMNIFGQETILSWIPENLLRIFFYRDLKDIAPPPGSKQGLFTETPMVNSRVLDLIREGKASWLRGDIEGFTKEGIMFKHRAQGVPKGGVGHERLVKADVCIMATGFKRPSLSFLPDKFFQPPYEPPNWYIQTFPPYAPPTVNAINCTYQHAIGTVGNWHIGIYTRLLLSFVVDPLAQPNERLMRMWIDMTRFIKRTAPAGAFDFFTYAELIYWFVFVLIINPFRWKWAPFVLFGIGSALPLKVVEQENRVRKAVINGQNGSAKPQVNGIK